MHIVKHAAENVKSCVLLSLCFSTRGHHCSDHGFRRQDGGVSLHESDNVVGVEKFESVL